jgi:hypothetical protein
MYHLSNPRGQRRPQHAAPAPAPSGNNNHGLSVSRSGSGSSDYQLENNSGRVFRYSCHPDMNPDSTPSHTSAINPGQSDDWNYPETFVIRDLDTGKTYTIQPRNNHSFR